MSGCLAPVMYWALLTPLCSALRSEAEQLPYQAVMLSMLQLFNLLSLRTHAKSLRGNRFCRALFTTVLVCLDHSSLLVMWTPRNLMLSTCSTSPQSVTICLDYIEAWVVILAPPNQVSELLPIGCLIVVSDQAYHCCVIGKLNDGVGVVSGRAVMSEQGVQEGTEHAPLRGPCVGSKVSGIMVLM